MNSAAASSGGQRSWISLNGNSRGALIVMRSRRHGTTPAIFCRVMLERK